MSIKHLTTAACAAALAALSGCATYTDNLAGASLAAYSANYPSAIQSVNHFMGVERSDELPSKWGADSSLATLERGVLHQAVESYKNSSRDLTAAEQQVELLELTRDPVGTLGGYIYSDSAKPYAAPPSERLALNALNLLNSLAVGDLSAAAVEARRFQVMREYLQTQGISERGVASFGTYLSGFVFEKMGEGDRALRYYEETLAASPQASLTRPVTRLARANVYRGPNVRTVLEKKAAVDRDPSGELLVVVGFGRVAHKVPERMPIGAAIGIAGSYVTQDYRWLTRGATKVVVYPELVPTQSSLYGQPAVRVDGREVPAEPLMDLDAAVRREYQDMKPKIIAAALVRVASRAAVSEGVRAAGKRKDDALGEVLGILVEGAMVATDRPDTRSWTMLPGKVAVARVPATAGSHEVVVDIPGNPSVHRTMTVNVSDNGYAAVVVTEPR